MIKLIHRTVFFYSAITLVIFPATLFAEAEVVSKPVSMSAFSLMNMLNMVMGLVVVVALILGLAWVLKKYGRLPSHNMVDMKVLGGLSLGTREKAILIEVENTRLLVGVTPGHIQTLHVLGELQEKPSVGKQSDKNISFGETLSKEVEKKIDV